MITQLIVKTICNYWQKKLPASEIPEPEKQYGKDNIMIGTGVFTYKRSTHTKKVLTALAHNSVLPSKLYLFHDGLKGGEDDTEWHKVQDLLEAIDWCEKEIIVSESNRGLAESIMAGVSYMFEECDSVIVLEDDCVPAKNFMQYMNQCLTKYHSLKDAHAVSGYGWPIAFPKSKFDVYACGRISSWGWGTWKDRWKEFHRDYTLLRQLRSDQELSLCLETWGHDLENMLINQVRGDIDSWAVFWALYVIKHRGFSINPYVSLIENIGLDGSGEHCDKNYVFRTKLEYYADNLILPDYIEIEDSIKQCFAEFYNSYTASREVADTKEDVIIYGLGKTFFENEKVINQKYKITGFIDNYKKGYYAGIKICKENELNDLPTKKIIIMIQNRKEYQRIKERMQRLYGIKEDRIITI